MERVCDVLGATADAWIELDRGGREARLTAWALKGKETKAKPSANHTRGEAKHKQTRATRDTPTRDKLQAHPHRSAKATVQQATADNLRPPDA
jgi:hypothetical protein